MSIGELAEKGEKTLAEEKDGKNRARINPGAVGIHSRWALCSQVRLTGPVSSGTRPKVYSMATVPLSSGRVRVAVTTSPVRL